MTIQYLIESALYSASQLFMLPVLLAVLLMFFYAFYAVGAFLWQSRQRRQQLPAAYDLLASWQTSPQMSAVELEALAFKRLEAPRIVTRVTPMLGLVATMIPMGPAIKSLADGQLAQVSDHLTVAFSAVILSLVAASLTYWVVNVRRRWYAEELVMIEQAQRGASNTAPLAAGLPDAAHDLVTETA
ncbi:MAG: MotA/TolQ/ExbB proton channel family protein [Halopseudomonas yangmingensis]|uniref:MotA/TolQ/ExbB proton channel family protein n=1 Tax=Halopseudomonas yangmingensis TaxID=1720063 RepID=A0A1I4RYC9_9GAMM|nr:MotA/TolQ/ExbB proton channel family protein [Halopseudomonas yangmingensis]SFM57014.1 MotA/TolQ/ExbB proton channel family protein [Halopseudomonas yangmingensis]